MTHRQWSLVGTDTITGHGTQKPVELMRRPVLNHTEPGELVYDRFLASGTTRIGAEETARVCYALGVSWQLIRYFLLGCPKNTESFCQYLACGDTMLL